MYGTECLAIYKTDARKVDALDQWCLRMLLGIKWYQFVQNDDVRRLTKQPKLTAIIQTRRRTLFGHIMRMVWTMNDNADAKRILLASLKALEKTSPHHVGQHFPTGSETTPPYAPKAPDWLRRRMMSTYGATQSWSCMPETTTSHHKVSLNLL